MGALIGMFILKLAAVYFLIHIWFAMQAKGFTLIGILGVAILFIFAFWPFGQRQE